MANTYKVLLQTQLPNAVATLATVGAAKMWIIKLITVVNNDGSIRTYALYVNGTTAAHIITPGAVSLPASGGASGDDDTRTLNAGDTLAGVASVASQLTITVYGDEVS